jgi:hypothetical protein
VWVEREQDGLPWSRKISGREEIAGRISDRKYCEKEERIRDFSFIHQTSDQDIAGLDLNMSWMPVHTSFKLSDDLRTPCNFGWHIVRMLTICFSLQVFPSSGGSLGSVPGKQLVYHRVHILPVPIRRQVWGHAFPNNFLTPSTMSDIVTYLVTVDGVWIGNRIYWTRITRNYK